MRRRRALCATAGALSLAGCLFDGGLGGRGDCEIDGHERGEIAIVVDGAPVDLGADRYQAEHADDHSLDFHLHEGSDEWYMDCERVTFAAGVDLIPHFAYERIDGEHVLTHDDETYDAREAGTAIEFHLNGEAVDPTDRRLEDGDELVVEVTTVA